MMTREILSLKDNFKLDPLFDNFIGFNDLFNKMETSLQNKSQDNFPPFDIYTANVECENSTESHTFIDFAVAGIERDRLSVEMTPDNILTVKTIPVDYEKRAKEMEKISKNYIRKGIADRNFMIQKTISKDLQLVSCKLSDGILTIEFKPKLEQSPVKITIE